MFYRLGLMAFQELADEIALEKVSTRLKVMMFNDTFNNISVTFVYCGGHFYWWRKLEYQEKTTDMSQDTNKLSHNVVSSTPHHELDSNSQRYINLLYSNHMYKCTCISSYMYMWTNISCIYRCKSMLM